MNDLKIPVLLLLIVLCGVGYFVYDKAQNPKAPVKVTKRTVNEVSEPLETEDIADSKVLNEDTKKKALNYFKNGDYEKALDLLNNIKEFDDYEIQHMLGYCYSAKKEYDRAIVAFEKALNIRKVPADGYSLAYLYEITGRFSAAAGLYEELITLELPPSLRRSVLEGIARIANYFPDNSRFAELSRELVESSPESAEGVVNLFKLMKYRHDFSGLDELVNKTLELHEEDYSYCYALAQLYDEAGNCKQAVKFYKKCIKLKPDTYAPFMDCYNALTKANETAAAVKALEYFLDSGQGYPTIYFKASLEANRLQRYKTALRLYIHAVCRDVKLQGKDDEGLVHNVENEYKTKGSELEKSFVNAFICYLNGDCKYALSELERIESDIQNSIYKEDYELVLNATKTVLSIDKKRDDEQQEYLRKLKAYEDKLKADEEEKRQKAQMAEKKRNDIPGQLKQLSDAELKNKVMRASKDFDLDIFAGVEFFARGNNDNAKLCYKLAMSANNSSALPYINMTKIYFIENNNEKALYNIEEAIKREPDNVDALSIASSLYITGNDLNKAEVCAQKAYSLNPESSQGIITYANFCIHNKNFNKAKELINIGLSKEKNNIVRASLLSLKRKAEEGASSVVQEESSAGSSYDGYHEEN